MLNTAESRASAALSLNSARANCPVLWDALRDATGASGRRSSSAAQQGNFLLNLIESKKNASQDQEESLRFVPVIGAHLDSQVRQKLQKAGAMVLLPGQGSSRQPSQQQQQQHFLSTASNDKPLSNGNHACQSAKQHRVIFDVSLLRMDVKQHHPLFGLINPSTFCYLNSSVQALLNVAPLVNYLREYHATPQLCSKRGGVLCVHFLKLPTCIQAMERALIAFVISCTILVKYRGRYDLAGTKTLMNTSWVSSVPWKMWNCLAKSNFRLLSKIQMPFAAYLVFKFVHTANAMCANTPVI